MLDEPTQAHAERPALGDVPASDRALRQALELYRAIGATGRAERLARELGA